MSKPEAIPVQKQVTIEELSQTLEAIADSLAVIQSTQEKHDDAIEEIKGNTEEILNSLETIAFKADYPGLDE